VPSPKLLAAIREFTTSIVNPYDQQDLLHQVTNHAVELTGSQGAGIMLAGAEEGHIAYAAASDARVEQVEVTQDETSSGPCYEAYLTQQVTTVEDLERTDRWPEYQQRALELGFRSVAGIPMHAWGQTIGVLNVYRDAPGPWSPEDVETLEIVTAMGAGYVLHADRIRAQHDLATQLQTALASRDLIGQAKGVLMARHDVDAETAFEMLRRTSQQTNVKLREVAQRLVETECPDPSR
jgi:GAF domain-containing protein